MQLLSRDLICGINVACISECILPGSESKVDAAPKPEGTADGCSQMGGFSKTTTYAHTVTTAPVNPRTGSSGWVSFVRIVSSKAPVSILNL